LNETIIGETRGEVTKNDEDRIKENKNIVWALPPTVRAEVFACWLAKVIYPLQET